MNIENSHLLGAGVSIFGIGKPHLFRAPNYVGVDKEFSSANIMLLENKIQKRIIIANQFHSSNVAVLDSNNKYKIPLADAMITQLIDVALFIIASDCVPILLYDPKTHSVGAIHAGRKGLEGNIIENTMNKLYKCFSSQSGDVRAYIGPCISQQFYEVGQDEMEKFKEKFPEYISKVSDMQGKYLLDIGAIALQQLLSTGITIDNITISGECTYENNAKYHSYRRYTHKSESSYGNNVFGIGLS